MENKVKKKVVAKATGCLFPVIIPMIIVIAMLGTVGAAVDALCNFFSGIATGIGDFFTPAWVKEIDQNIKDSTCIDLDDLRTILNMECASYENDVITIEIGMNKSKENYSETDLMNIEVIESDNGPAATPTPTPSPQKTDDPDREIVPQPLATPKPRSNSSTNSSASAPGPAPGPVPTSAPPPSPDIEVEDEPELDNWRGKYTYDNREGTYQYRLPWQFVYATAVCMNAENFMADQSKEPDMSKYTDEELEKMAQTGSSPKGNDDKKEFIVRTEDLELIKKTFNTKYVSWGNDYYKKYKQGITSYTFNELSALPHISRANGDILIPYNAYSCVKSYLYTYKYSFENVNGNTVIKASQKIFNKDDFLYKLETLGITKKNMDMLYFVLNKSYEGSAIANEITSALNGTNGVVSENGDTSSIDDEFFVDDPITNEDDSTTIENLEYPPGGLRVPLYYQNHAEWANNPFGDSTISECGCCPTALSMILTYYKQEAILPSDVVDWTAGRWYVKGQGSSWAMINKVSGHWGYDSKQIKRSTGTFISYLDKKVPVLIDIGPSQFTSGGHFMVIRGYTIENNKKYFLINDPYYRRKDTQNAYIKFPAGEIVSDLKAAWVISK